MLITNISNFTKGWVVGDFDPAIIHSKDVEVGIHHYPKGFVSEPHIHKLSREINCIVKGQVLLANAQVLNSGDIWTFEPEEYEVVEFLEDTELVVIKSPSIPNDKHPLPADWKSSGLRKTNYANCSNAGSSN